MRGSFVEAKRTDKRCPRIVGHPSHGGVPNETWQKGAVVWEAMRSINPPGSNIPGISQAMIIEASRLVFLSGHVPVRPDGTIAGPDLEAQLVQVFINLGTTLTAAGSSFDDLVRVTLYVRDYRLDLLDTIRRVRDRFVNSACPPASALIGVAALFHPDVLVEVDAVAVAAGPP